MTKSPPPGCVQTIQAIEDTINLYVGARLRHGRDMLGMTQQELAVFLDVAYQQVQKYESGKNRIGAAKLYRFSQLIRVSPNFFFDGLESGEPDERYNVLARRVIRRILEAPPRVQRKVDRLLKDIASESDESC